jgi:hypothetical protein
VQWDEIVNIVQSRRNNEAALIRKMIDTRDRYNADVVIPMADVEGEPFTPPLGPQVIHDGIEHTAMRASATMPTISCPALDPHKPTGKRSTEYATIRRDALHAAHHYSLTQLLLGRAFRMMSAYGTSAMVVVPDFTDERARVEVRSSLNAYPDPRSYDDYRPPKNCAFVYGRSYAWCKDAFGPVVEDLISVSSEISGLWDVCEWMDADEIVMGVIGPRSPFGIDLDATQPGGGIETRRWPNRAGMVTAAVGKRVTLDRIAGQMEIITGAADWLDKLMALEVEAAQQGVFPDMYAIAEENRTPELIGGEWKDGRSGDINLLANVKAVGQLVAGASSHSQQVISMLERGARSSGGAIPQFGGEAPGSLRTGRAIDTLGSFSVDPRVAEMQRVMEAMMSRTLNPGILAIEKGYWPDKRYVCFSGSISSNELVEYTPQVHFESDENSVAYSFPGMDISSISVALLQLVGGDLIPKRQARVRHPLIEDPDRAGQEITIERIDESVLINMQQQSASGALPLIDQARIRQLVGEGLPIADAILKADEEARARQAAVPPPPSEGMAAAPEQMPGLAMPGMGAETGMAPEGQPQIQGPMPSQENLRHFLRTLQTQR